jgi:hypothetical protein
VVKLLIRPAPPTGPGPVTTSGQVATRHQASLFGGHTRGHQPQPSTFRLRWRSSQSLRRQPGEAWRPRLPGLRVSGWVRRDTATWTTLSSSGGGHRHGADLRSARTWFATTTDSCSTPPRSPSFAGQPQWHEVDQRAAALPDAAIAARSLADAVDDDVLFFASLGIALTPLTVSVIGIQPSRRHPPAC